MKKFKVNKNIIVSLIVIIVGICGIFINKAYINSKAVDGTKEYKVTVTDSDNTFNEKFEIKTEETSLGKDLAERGLIEFENGAYGRFVIGVHERKADESKKEWWNLVINGENSPTGIDDVMINDGDEVEFILTTGW